jgi:hypothetical protein
MGRRNMPFSSRTGDRPRIIASFDAPKRAIMAGRATGVPARMFYQVNFEVLGGYWPGYSLAETAKPVWRKAPNWHAQIRQTGMAETAKLLQRILT